MKRESFKSRLGFILISAGCAIGIGNVWRFPYVVGNNGGGAFVLLYLFFLIMVGVPVMTMEFAVGRASRQSAVGAYKKLEPAGSKWHIHGWFCLAGCYLLMMFYTSVSGWMLDYFFKFLTGTFAGLDTQAVGGVFSDMLADPFEVGPWMAVTVIVGFAVCSMGLQKGLERISKWMMLALLCLIVVLSVRSLTLPGAMAGVEFYLKPNLDHMQTTSEALSVITAAMNQSFFTLSLGIAAMEIFGSYMDKSHTLLGESMRIAALDTFVAFFSGLIIFPACFSFGINPDSGPSLIFITLPNVFISMPGGRLWGSLFFLFMTFASFSTILAVFENILACCMEQFGWSRQKASAINLVLMLVASLPCVLGFNVWSDFQPLGAGTGVLDLEDFLVSNLLLPIGSMVYLLFCVTKWGWGFDNYLAEANTGDGMRIPRWMKYYFMIPLPLLVLALIAQSLGLLPF